MSRQALNGRVVAITGGARGIGFATARACAHAGMRVAIGDLDPAAGEAAAAGLSTASIGVGLDVADPASFAAFLDETEDRLGPLQVMVNNAGIHHAGSYVEEDPAVTARLLAVNLAGVLEGSRLALRRFVPRDEGHLVNIASIGGLIGVPRNTTYCATKFAVVGFTRSLRQELHGTGVHTTLVCPGHIDTDMTTDFARLPLVRVLEPEQIGDGIVAALEDGSPEVVLPRELVATTRLLDLAPARVADVVARAAGIGRLNRT